MATSIDIMDLGRQGLAANQQALQTTSNNVANANTPGYTRQRAIMESSPTLSAGGKRVGGGVNVDKVVRIHDAFLQGQIVDESRHLGNLQARVDSMKTVENLVAEQGNGISELVNRFFNDVRDLSANPELATLRNNVSLSAEEAANGFRRLNNSLNQLKTSIDEKIDTGVHEVNSMTKELGKLNVAIRDEQARHNEPNELYDQRDRIVRDLSKKLGLEVTRDDLGNVNILTGGAVLVSGDAVTELQVVRTPEKGQKAAGSVDICVKSGDTFTPVTKQLNEGEIGGLIHSRDQVVNPALANLDNLAYRFATSVNSVHREGYGADGKTGRNIFNEIKDPNEASRLIKVSDEVRGKPDAIAAGKEADLAGDNRLALKLSQLQNAKIIGDVKTAGDKDSAEEKGENFGKHTLNEAISGWVGDLGAQAREEGESLHNQEAVMKQLDNYRQSVSGVSLEEEAMNMMRYQSVFNASAKAMKVGDELMQTVLSLK